MARVIVRTTRAPDCGLVRGESNQPVSRRHGACAGPDPQHQSQQARHRASLRGPIGAAQPRDRGLRRRVHNRLVCGPQVSQGLEIGVEPCHHATIDAGRQVRGPELPLRFGDRDTQSLAPEVARAGRFASGRHGSLVRRSRAARSSAILQRSVALARRRRLRTVSIGQPSAAATSSTVNPSTQ